MAYFRERDPFGSPLVYTLFHTGLRAGVVVGLRYGALDLRLGKLTVRVSRTKGEDNAPKTARSERTLTLLPEVIEVLRAMPAPLHLAPDNFVSRAPTGLPIDRDRFTGQHWHRRAPLASSPVRAGTIRALPVAPGLTAHDARRHRSVIRSLSAWPVLVFARAPRVSVLFG